MLLMDADVAPPKSAVPALIEEDSASFREDFNHRSFAFRHRLGNHPLFTIPSLAKTAQKLIDAGKGDRFVVFDAKSFGAGTSFGNVSPSDRLASVLHRLPEVKTWLKLSSVNEADPAYDAVLRQIIGDLSDLTGQDLASEITWSSLTVFVASPQVSTPYHIDHESNFLFQIEGDKEVCLFNQEDRMVLSETEIERFYAGDPEAARYKPDLQDHGTVYQLRPGVAVHHPPLAPHWVKNGDNVSVSVSIGFCMRSLDQRAKIYQVNNLLRRVGMRPTQPGQSPLSDRLKTAGLTMASKPNAVSRSEILFSGINRVTAPLRLANRLSGGVLRRGR